MKGLDNYLTDEPNTRERIEWRNSIHLGDCIEIMKGIPTAGVDMILCDLPYGTTACAWDTTIPFELLWKEYKRIIKKGGAIVLFGTEPFSSYLRISNIKDYKYDWKWDKVIGSNFVHAKRMPLKVYEDIMVFNANNVYNPKMVERDKKNERKSGVKDGKNLVNVKFIQTDTSGKKKYPINKIEINRLSNELNSNSVLHPTQKPLALLQYLIITYTKCGEVVLDNCMGSGSTCVACKNTGRTYIGIEKEEKYYKIAEQRLTSLF